MYGSPSTEGCHATSIQTGLPCPQPYAPHSIACACNHRHQISPAPVADAAERLRTGMPVVSGRLRLCLRLRRCLIMREKSPKCSLGSLGCGNHLRIPGNNGGYRSAIPGLGLTGYASAAYSQARPTTFSSHLWALGTSGIRHLDARRVFPASPIGHRGGSTRRSRSGASLPRRPVCLRSSSRLADEE